MRTIALVTLIVALVFASAVLVSMGLRAGPAVRAVTVPSPGMTMAPMAGGGMLDPTPPVNGFYNGRQITFIHTEASDPKVATMLTKMMGPKVLVVPSLRDVPARLLATVYVFANGVKGEGPFGFQADVFDSAPGDARYTPLRTVTLVGWKGGAPPRVLRSADEVRTALARGQVGVQRPGVVVNMPFLTWPGGHR